MREYPDTVLHAGDGGVVNIRAEYVENADVLCLDEVQQTGGSAVVADLRDAAHMGESEEAAGIVAA